MADKSYDIAVIGGGPGGYVAAIRASQLGAKVALIEKDKVGGTCLNRGCIPTKALLYSINLYERFLKAENFGISAQNISINLAKVVERKNKVVEKLVKGVEFLLEKNKVDLIYGEGKVVNPTSIEVLQESSKLLVVSRKLILATGSSPVCLPGMSFEMPQFLSSDDILNNKEVPQKFNIVGGGVIGLHFAYMYSALGSEVTIYEAMPDILQGLDEEIVQMAKRFLARRKITIKTGVRFSKEESSGTTLICVGRALNTSPFEALGLKMNKRNVWVNEKMETSIPNVYAIGDIASPKMFAHVATEQGLIAVENALGGNKTFDESCVPYTIYTNPEIASVGMTEKEAKEKFQDIKIGKFPFATLGISQAMGEIEGFVKIVCSNKNEILGVHIIGPQANTLIGAATLCVKQKLSAEKLAETIQAHPSYPEGLQEAAMNIFKQSIHTLN